MFQGRAGEGFTTLEAARTRGGARGWPSRRAARRAAPPRRYAALPPASRHAVAAARGRTERAVPTPTRASLVAEGAVTARPALRALPTAGGENGAVAREHLERPQSFRLADQFQHPTAHRLGPADNGCIRAIGPDQLQPRESALEFLQDQLGPVSVLDARRVDYDGQEQAEGGVTADWYDL